MQRVPKILAEYETEEQKHRRKLRNLFAELSEEERELFKKLVKEQLEDGENDIAREVERAWSKTVERAENQYYLVQSKECEERFVNRDYLQRHPYLADSPRYGKLSRYLDVYLEFRKTGISTPQEFRDFADNHNIPYHTVETWYSRKSQPELLNTIESHDKARTKFENSLSEQARENLIDPSDVFHSLRPLKDVPDPSENLLAESLVKLCSQLDEDNRMKWARFYPYHAKGPMWLKDVGERISEKREEVEHALNEKLGLDENPCEEIRVGVVGNKLYLRLKNIQPYVWSNLYREENFHLKTLKDKKNLIIAGREALGLKGNIEFGRLAGQIADYSKSIEALNTNADLRYLRNHISGGTLDLINDALGQTLREIQDKVDYIGRGKQGYGVIRNPQLDTTPEKVIVPLVSIIGSDGHIEPTYHIRYTEGRPERVELVKDAFNQLGDVDQTEEVDDKGNIILHAPAVVGRLLGKVGMKPGDKAIQNESLADIARNASPNGIKDYAKELIPEDGSFSVDSEGYGEFQWYRSVVLDAGVKTEKYNHTSLISEEEKEFIKNKVEPQMMDFGSDEAREVYTMKIGHLKKLMDDSDPEVSAMAKRLYETIENNPSKLLEDEREILSKIGITTNSYATNIRVFKDTGRVSVSWQGQTATNDDVKTWAREAMPNDKKKAKAVKEWLDSL